MVQAYNVNRPNRSYGWRPSLPDIRDFKFVPNFSTQALMPATYDLDTPSPGSPFDPCWDQSTLGSCGPHTLSENIVFDLLKDLVPNVVMPSRLFLYYVTRALMGTINSDSGVDNRTMLKALAQYGWCDESLWPYNISKFTQQPPQQCFNQATTRAGLIQYQAVNQDLNTMKACLYQTGRPIIFGFTVYNSLETPQVDATGDVPMPGLTDRVVGGHDVLIVGWDDLRQRFKFKNHWTPQWGNNGYGTIPYHYALSAQLAGDFWVVLKAPVSPPGPTPSPPPGPTPSPPPGPTPSPPPPPPTPLPPPPPTPSPPAPPSPQSFKQRVDAVFGTMISQYGTSPWVQNIIRGVQSEIDKLIPPGP